MIAVLAGATGLVGRNLLNALLERSEVEHIYSLQRSTAEPNTPRVTRLDLGAVLSAIESGSPAPWPAGAVFFSCLGTTLKQAGSREDFRAVDHDLVLRFGRAAQATQASRFVCVSSVGADRRSAFFYSKVKGECEEALIRLGLPQLTIARPSLLIGSRVDIRPLEALAQTAALRFGSIFNSVFNGPLIRYRPIDAAKLARRLVDLAMQPELERVLIVEGGPLFRTSVESTAPHKPTTM